jgi:hypothetical protein
LVCKEKEQVKINVVARNRLFNVQGRPEWSKVLERPPRPIIASPATSQVEPLRIATGLLTSGKPFAHIWADGYFGARQTPAGKDKITLGRGNSGVVTIQIDNFGGDDVLETRMVWHLGVGNQSELNFTKDRSDDRSTTISVRLPQYGENQFPCTDFPCQGTIQLSSPAFPSNRLDVYVQYFKYSDPELVSLQPSGGSQTGGMPVQVRVRDFVGIESRVAAALPSFEDCIPPQQVPEISVLARVKCSGHKKSQPVEGI